MDDEQRAIFVGFVDAGFSKQLIVAGMEIDVSNEAEILEHEMKDHLQRMLDFKRSGYAFDHSAYSKGVLETIYESPSEKAMRIFLEYCYFEDKISMLEFFPSIQKRLLMAGLDSWATLQVDTQTLREFAFLAIEKLGEVLMRSVASRSDSHAETAGHIWRIADLFEVVLVPELQAVVDWYMDNGAETFDNLGCQNMNQKVTLH